MRRSIYVFITSIFLLSSLAFAKQGLLFNVIPSGTPTTVDIILCLNGMGPLSCQKYLVSAQNLNITTVTNHYYVAAGIKVLTPGYTASGCTYYAKTGYCLFKASNTASAQINLSPPTQTAYVTPTFLSSIIDQFAVDLSTGLFLSNPATAYSSNTQQYQHLTFEVVNGVQYAYVLDPFNGAVYWCTINPDGSFGNCLPTTQSSNFELPHDIAFATFNAQYAYIVDPGNNFVYQCAPDTTGGSFSSCPYNESLPIYSPYGIAFATDGNGDQQAYIADAGMGVGYYGDVLRCSMHADGTFNSCNQTPSLGAPSWIPYDVAFTNVNGTQYAYVADNGTGPPGHVYRCTLNPDGTFVNSGCTQTPENDNLLSNWYPYSIVFQTVNEQQYAYVVNNAGSNTGNIYTCLLDENGLLTACELTLSTTPPSWLPYSIAFR